MLQRLECTDDFTKLLAEEVLPPAILEYIDNDPSSVMYRGPDWPTKTTSWLAMPGDRATLQELACQNPSNWGRLCLRFLYVTNTLYEMHCLVQSYILVGNECPINGYSSQAMGMGWKKRVGEFLQDF